jgi:quercetin dioxygenase-like cupin family protein
VISGTLLWGTGDTIDTSKAMVLPAGSFVVVPKDVHHWALAKGTTVVQVEGMGPFVRHDVKPNSM